MSDSYEDGDFVLAIQPDTEKESKIKSEKLEAVFTTVNSMLGGTSWQLELTETDYRVAFNRALAIFRAQSSRSINESYGFLLTRPTVQTYKLHEAIDNVIQIYRKRALFGTSATGFDYFAQVAAGLIYPGSQPGGYLGIATYDFALQYEETLGRMFARDWQFKYRPESNTLYLASQPKGEEMVVLLCAVQKTVKELLSDHWANNWMTQATQAYIKMILGEKRSRFTTMPGVQGGIQQNGEALKAEGKEMLKDLEQEILDFRDGGVAPYAIMA